MQTSNANFQSNTLSTSPTHHCFHAFTPKSRAFFSSLQFLTSLLLLVSLFSIPTLAQVDCVDPGGIATVVVNVTNPMGGATANRTFTGALPIGGGHTAITNSCVATIGGVATGTCTIGPAGLAVNWTGTIPDDATVTITYRVRIAATAANNTTLTINNTANGDSVVPATSNVAIGCPLLTPVATASTVRVSDQKPGSVLVFPYYTSTIAAAPVNDTRISITNAQPPSLALNQTRPFEAFVHVFLVDGRTCMQTDFYVCLTRGATCSFQMNSMDPGITGYVLAVAVDGVTGLPVQNNVLIGNAFVNTPDYFGNYGAESFAANSSVAGTLYADYGGTAKLFFDGVGYDAPAKEFAVEIQSAVDVVAPFQKIVTAGMNGDLSLGTLDGVTGAVQLGSGQITNQNEDSKSVNSIVTSSTCQAQGTGLISPSLRVAGGLNNLIQAGMSGTAKFRVGGAVGVLLTPRTAKWGGIRTLHKTATVATCLAIPVFPISCLTK